MASPSSLFDKTMHLRARWVRAEYAAGAFAIGAVSAYVAGRSSFAGRAISSPHGAGEIAFTGIDVPQSVTLDREEIWLLADRLERKPDGDYRRNAGHMPRIASHLDAALPWDIGADAARRIVEGFSRWIVDTYGVAVEFAAHNKEKPLDHAHFLVGTRMLTKEGFGKKVRAMNGIAQQHADRENGNEIAHQRADGTIKRVSSAMDEIRARWAELVTAEIGHVVDHRSYERRGLDIKPVPRVRRGEIEFQKRLEQRTGAAPEWRRDRARRLAERTKTPATMVNIAAIATPVRENGGVVRDGRRKPARAIANVTPATTSARAAERYIARLREDIDARAIIADDTRLAIGRHLDQTEMARGEDISGHPGTPRNHLAVNGSVREIAGSSRWRRRSDEILGKFGNERSALIGRHKRESGELQRRQRVTLLLVEKLASHDAPAALRRLTECARSFAAMGGSLVTEHDGEWQKLLAAQRSGWRLALQEDAEIEKRTTPEAAGSTSNAVIVARHMVKQGVRKRRRSKSTAPTLFAEMVDRQIENIRDQIASRQLAAHDETREAARRTNDAEASQAEQILNRPAGRTKHTPDGSFRAFETSPRWKLRSDDIRNDHSAQHAALIDRQNREKTELGRRQRLILTLLEKLKQSDAALALRRLVVCARRFADEAKTLVAAHDEQWLKLLSAQRTAWRVAAEEEVHAQRQGSGKTDGSRVGASAVSNGVSHDRMLKRRRREATASTGQRMASAMLASLRKRVDVSPSASREAWKIQADKDDSDRITHGRSEIRTRAFAAVQRKNSAVAVPDAKFDKMADGFCTRWQERVIAALAGQNRARHDMLRAQEQDDIDQRCRQNLTLALIERIIALDAVSALHHLLRAVRNFAHETHALLERQGQAWLDLVAAQRQAWPSLPEFRENETAAPNLTGSQPISASSPPNSICRVIQRPQGAGAARDHTTSVQSSPTHRSRVHVGIVEEMADWLVLRNGRTSHRNILMASYLGEPMEAFDARTNQRHQAALEQARSLGPGQAALWAPRSPKEILSDPTVKSSADLRDLVEAVGARSRSPAPLRSHQPGSDNVVAKSPNEKGR